MDQKEKAMALAGLFQNGMTKGTMVDFAIGFKDGLGIQVAETPTNQGDCGICEYQLDKQQVIHLNEVEKVIIAVTTKGHTHVFLGTYCADIEWVDPIYYLGDITD